LSLVIIPHGRQREIPFNLLFSINNIRLATFHPQKIAKKLDDLHTLHKQKRLGNVPRSSIFRYEWQRQLSTFFFFFKNLPNNLDKYVNIQQSPSLT